VWFREPSVLGAGEGRNATGERLMQATGLLGLNGMDAVASGHTLCQAEAEADECIQIMGVVEGHVDATNRAPLVAA
jgi:hypothetical protein